MTTLISKLLTPEQLAQAYQNACMAELLAIKPGNVHMFADGHGMTVHDFIKSAEVSAVAIAQPNLSVGQRILHAVEATQQAVGMNTNLGLILLCAPLIHAAADESNDATQTLQQSLVEVLRQLTIADAQLASQAIVLANPAGLGEVAQNSVYDKPQVTLLEMMCSAQLADRIAWQYSNAFSDVFDFGVTRYLDAMIKWENESWATAALYLGFLSRQLDTHIVRKYGNVIAEEVMLEAQDIESDYWQNDNPKLVQSRLLAWDVSLKARNINPGTSADLTVATVLAASLG
ncbi:ATP:dephospho-CoA triphosphoribosyl transferase [mine drainage metagenome]|uniref:ATP:dephospho-CoA triphosphoribosyl transferase n=1 Tax=mine drainage metagenome TaxID=410659 RepID=A0A1J5TC69_9ZZZZ